MEPLEKTSHDLTKDLDKAITDWLRLRNFVSVAGSGIQTATEAVEWVLLERRAAEVLKQPDPYPSEEHFKRHQEEAKSRENFAKEEASRGFPYLHSIAIVRMWSILEVAVDDLIRRLLRTPDVLPTSGVIAEIKGPLLPFINASAEDRAEFMFVAFKQKLSVALRPGIAGMEELLKPFGLHGPINDTVRRLLLEMGAVRNVLVHRNGIADRRFVDACPWLRYCVGRQLSLRNGHFQIYAFAVEWYLFEIRQRVVRKFNLTEGQEKEVSDLQQIIMSTIDRLLKDRPDADLIDGTAARAD